MGLMKIYSCRESIFCLFRLAQWIKESAEKRKEAEEEKKARRERRRAGPKHVFTDHEYMNQIQANAENIDDALKQGGELAINMHQTCVTLLIQEWQLRVAVMVQAPKDLPQCSHL